VNTDRVGRVHGWLQWLLRHGGGLDVDLGGTMMKLKSDQRIGVQEERTSIAVADGLGFSKGDEKSRTVGSA
jgi:hypothetical protein